MVLVETRLSSKGGFVVAGLNRDGSSGEILIPRTNALHRSHCFVVVQLAQLFPLAAVLMSPLFALESAPFVRALLSRAPRAVQPSSGPAEEATKECIAAHARLPDGRVSLLSGDK